MISTEPTMRVPCSRCGHLNNVERAAEVVFRCSACDSGNIVRTLTASSAATAPAQVPVRQPRWRTAVSTSRPAGHPILKAAGERTSAMSRAIPPGTALAPWHAEGVHLAQVEAALAQLRAEAAAEAPSMRTSVMTHIAWVPHGWREPARGYRSRLVQRDLLRIDGRAILDHDDGSSRAALAP